MTSVIIRVSSLGVLRFFLAYAVLISHCPEGVLPINFHPGLAVQCFFVISGFYMQLLIMQRYPNKAPKDFIKDFYSSRALRIFPTYLLILLAVYLFQSKGQLLYIFETKSIKSLLLYIFTNVFIFGQSLLRMFPFDLATETFVLYEKFSTNSVQVLPTFIGQAWSLDVELLFYLIAPFILSFKKTWPILFVFSLSILLRIALALKGYNYSLSYAWVNEFFPSEIATFLLGSLSYRILHNFNTTTLLHFKKWGAKIFEICKD